jgi:hypothetical protein
MDSEVALPAARDLERRYGLSIGQYLELLEAQGGVCAVCGKPPKDDKPLVVDHCHDGLTVDGLVHGSPCNRALTQQVRRYLADPPGRRLGLKVPVELEQATIAKRERAKAAARAGRAAKRAAGEADERRQREVSATGAKIREMTHREPADFSADVERALAESAAWTGGSVEVTR